MPVARFKGFIRGAPASAQLLNPSLVMMESIMRTSRALQVHENTTHHSLLLVMMEPIIIISSPLVYGRADERPPSGRRPGEVRDAEGDQRLQNQIPPVPDSAFTLRRCFARS